MNKQCSERAPGPPPVRPPPPPPVLSPGGSAHRSLPSCHAHTRPVRVTVVTPVSQMWRLTPDGREVACPRPQRPEAGERIQTQHRNSTGLALRPSCPPGSKRWGEAPT